MFSVCMYSSKNDGDYPIKKEKYSLFNSPLLFKRKLFFFPQQEPFSKEISLKQYYTTDGIALNRNAFHVLKYCSRLHNNRVKRGICRVGKQSNCGVCFF